MPMTGSLAEGDDSITQHEGLEDSQGTYHLWVLVFPTLLAMKESTPGVWDSLVLSEATLWEGQGQCVECWAIVSAIVPAPRDVSEDTLLLKLLRRQPIVKKPDFYVILFIYFS